MNNRLVISFRLVKASVHLLRANSELLIYPIISAFGTLLVLAVFTGSIFAIKGFDLDAVASSSRAFTFAATFLFYFVAYAVVFFANTALIGVVMLMLDGGQPSVGDGFRIARGRLQYILGYALIMATIGMIFRWVFQFGGVAGRLVGPTIRRVVLASVFGVAWHLVTYLVIPVLVMEGIGPIGALKRSSGLLKKTWGEQIAGNMSIWLLFSFPILLVIAAGYPLVSLAVQNSSETYTIFVLYLYIMFIVTLFLVKSTLEAIFSAVVYRYAVEGLPTEGFDEALMENAFRRSPSGLSGRARKLVWRRSSESGSESS
jgi:hypothetical protein